MVVANARHTVRASSAVDGNYPIEIQAAIVETVGQVDRVGMQGRNQVRTRREVLRPARMYERSS